MRNIKLFSKITYLVTNRFAYKDKNVVKVFYIYKNIYNIVLPLDIKKVKAHGYSDEAYYINEAKKIIDKMINNGSLDKFSKKYLKDKKKKSILLLAIPSICVCLALGISLGTYFALKSKAQEVNVEVPEINGLMFSNEKAYIGQDYDTNISVNTTLTTSLLPDTLNKVTSGNRTVQPTEYTYTVNDNKESGSLHIPGQYIEGDVKIELELVTPGPEYVNFDFTSETCNIKDKEGKDVTEVIKGETFEGKISLNQGVEGYLPGILDITMGDDNAAVAISDYDFNPYTGEFSIIPTGDIKINVAPETCDIAISYHCTNAGEQVILEVGSDDLKITWGDGGETSQPFHTYEQAGDYIIRIYNAYDLGRLDPTTGITSIASFDGYRGALGNLFDDRTGPLLEKICFGKQTTTCYLNGQFPKLNRLIVSKENTRLTDLDSNIVCSIEPGDEELVLELGCNNSVIPDNANIKIIGDRAFRGSNIEEIHIPSTVEEIEIVNPFRGCCNLRKLTVDSQSAFLTSRDQSGNERNMIATKVDTSVFHPAKRLVTATNSTIIPDDGTVTGLSVGAFSGLSLTKIDIPSCVQHLAAGSIINCPNLERVNFADNSELTELCVGDESYEETQQGSFYNCPLLDDFVIPASTSAIAISWPLFGRTNTGLTQITVLPAVPPTMEDEYGDPIPIYMTKPANLEAIYVPDDSVNAYKSASGWNIHSDLIKPLSERPTH